MTIEEKLQLFAPQAELMAGVVVIHEINGFKPVFMTSNGLQLLGLTMQELKSLGESYTERFLNMEFMEEYLQKLEGLLQKNDSHETFTFFHQVKLKNEWTWYLGSLRIFHHDSAHNPTHTITAAFPVDHLNSITNKAERLLAQNSFSRENLGKFSSLSKRAREILRLVAIGKSSAQIAEELHISVDTVNTHRKNIRQKLAISTTYEFTEYALAFDLI